MASEILQSRYCSSPLTPKRGGAAFGASRISDSLRHSDDHPAAGDIPRTLRDCTPQRAGAASARDHAR
jgi:hypothetical protein